MSYVLESQNEFDRLEYQSTLPMYNFRNELKAVVARDHDTILDAGCGSGIVTRYLASLNPKAQIIGCDAATDRLEQTQKICEQHRNIQIVRENLTQLSFHNNTFDKVICRYVLQHLAPKDRDKTLSELLRVLKPGGTLHIVEADGAFYSLYPQPPFIEKCLKKMDKLFPVDLWIGRKLPSILIKSGFSKEVEYEICASQFVGNNLSEEIEMNRARFESALPALTSVFGSEQEAKRFIEEYLKACKAPGAVYFYNKFLVVATKPKSLAKLKSV